MGCGIWKCATICFKKLCNCTILYCIGGEPDDESTECDEWDLEHYEKLLWYRYYKLYVVGYSKYIKLDEKTHEDQVPKTALDSPAPTQNEGLQSEGDDQPETCQQSCSLDSKYCCKVIWRIIRIILVLLKYIAQGTTVPLLMLQAFDTYALLCFFPNRAYCETVSEYEIHLAQVAITMGFYFCIALAQLLSTFLEWDESIQATKKNDNFSS